MASDRKKYVMGVELAIQREMAYCQKLELSHPKQNIEYGKNPFSQNQITPFSIPSFGASSNSKASVPSSWPEQSLLGSLISRPNTSPSSSPRPSLRSSPRPPPSPRPPVASSSPSNPFQRQARPSIPSKPILSHQGPNARPTCSARPILPSGLNPPNQRLAPPSPHPYRPQLQGLLRRPKLSPLGPIAHPSPPSMRPILLSSPYPGPRSKTDSGPIIILKRKEAPQLTHGDYGKQNKLFCSVCEVHCSSASNLKMHLEGQKHQAKVNQIQGVGKINAQVYCELCGIWCTNDFNYKQHLSGKSHTLKLHAAEKNK